MPTAALLLQISTELQAYAKEHGLNGEMEARSVGMEEMSEQFRSIGAEVYMVSHPAFTVPPSGCRPVRLWSRMLHPCVIVASTATH